MCVTLFAVALCAMSLAVRWRAWRVPGEMGASLAVLFLGLGTFLISEASPLGEPLWRATGYGYLDDFAGHLLWLGGIVALLHQALYRLADDDERAEILDALVRWPITLIVPLMLSSMYMSGALHAEPVVDVALLQSASGAWLYTYRAVWYGGLLYLTLLLVRVLRIMRNTEGGRQWVTCAYLAAAGFTLAAIAVRLVLFCGTLPALRDVPVLFRCAATSMVAVAAAGSWLGKMRNTRRLLRYTRTSRRDRRRDTLESHRLRVLLAAESILDEALDDLDDARARRDEGPPAATAQSAS
ncbi:membrane protein [Mycobacterium phage Krueger]|uniref:Membrane protein n=1 Tax=Mycobacterium phage Krueger TaxID=2015820 RepID=A0A222ZM46_9CAUD|nr:membrane protein [Mycobacterium phage Krueger]ASR85548.1 membrane protein [Mycobacterium phage Krueger]